MNLSNAGQIAVALASGGALLLGVLVSLPRMPARIRAAFVIAGPVVAIAVFAIGAPNCSYDCPDRAAWALISAVATAGWLVGCGIPAFVRRLSRLRFHN
jgi:hypothetical protein